MSEYFESLCGAMKLLSSHPRSIFMGQAVRDEGTAMSKTFRDVPREKLLELPVFEDTQMGMAIGMSLNGDLPICCYPRINFMLLAMNQLVLHLDKMPRYSKWRPKVIIRTAVAHNQPMDPGPQHLGTYVGGIAAMLDEISVEQLTEEDQIIPAYQRAMSSTGSTLIVEYLGRY